MIYRKGMKVEVLDKAEVPSGSWRLAEIQSGNGRTYSVKYDPPSPGTSELAERVARKHIRPRPPLVCDAIDWFPGDILEVFDHSSWKLAEVFDAVNQVFFSVRLLGSSQTLTVQRSDLRLRQCWEKDRWVPVGKDAEELPKKDKNCEKGLKGRQKRRADRPLSVNPGQRKRKKMPPAKKPKKNEPVDYGQTRFTEPDDASACSSSGSNDPDPIHRPGTTASSLDKDGLSDDASSSCWSTTGGKKSTTPRRDLAERIHRLELYAYRTTLEALYSSGSITWEQEELMTNLRLELHISNDEHLSELRYLSSQSS